MDRDPERQHLLEMADQSARRLRGLIDDILDFSRIEAGKIELVKEPFDLRGCVQETVDMFALPAKDKNLRIDMDVPPSVPRLIVGDSKRLAQVLVNLIGNAVKFTPSGEILVSVAAESDFLEFSVADYGIGIPEGKEGLIFNSFSQMDPSFTRRYGGTGLGLAISKGLVELMGGEISVRSRKEGGSTFVFTLPIRMSERPVTPATEEILKRPVPQPLAARILLAEDDPSIREMITLILRRKGWQVEDAENGQKALEQWEKGQFDIILMDLQMPVMNGLEATKAIRQREDGEGRHTCIIGLTAHARPEIHEECLASGMDGVLSKPVRMKNLYAAIENCLAE